MIIRKNILVLTLLVFFFSICKAQYFGPLGNIRREEIDLKECSFDKEAEAVVLVDEAFSNYNDQYNVLTYHHTRIKILKDKGIEHSNITIPFYRKDEFEYIDQIQGVTLNTGADGTVESVPLEKKSIYTEKTNEFWGKVKFAFPAVKTGSVIEYTYQSTRKYYDLKDWEFQWPIPVMQSKYKVVILPIAEFTYSVQKHSDYKIDIKPNKDEGSISFEMNNIPGLEKEPFMDAREDYVQKVVFQLSRDVSRGYEHKFVNTWPDLARFVMNHQDFGGQLGKDLAGTEGFIQEVKLLPSQFAKMKKTYDYVRQSMSWSGITSKFSVEGIKSAWNKKTGTNGEINLILINLLKSVDVDVDPVLVSERDNGKVNTTYPFLDQFNTVYACVTIEGKNFFLDATNKYTPAHIIPFDILNTTGFIVNRKNSKFITIKDDQFQYSEQISINANMGADGKLAGKAFIQSRDYARVIKLAGYKPNREKYIENFFTKKEDGISIGNFKTTNEDNDSLPLTQEFDFTIPVNASGDYQFINLNLFVGEKSNPFISNNRFSNINFGYRQKILLTIVMDLPADYIVDALPKPLRMVTPDKSLVFQKWVTSEAGKINASCQLEINKGLFEADEYSMLKEFYKRMFDSMNEQLVLKKK